jgi:hypothetical protein
MAEDYRAMARAAAQRHGVPPAMFEAQIQQESSWNPRAVSPSGAQGLAQIIPRYHPGVDPFDPPAALDYAARWMAALRQQFGSWRYALAAYNWGPGNVGGWDGQRTTTRSETRHYLDVILGSGWPEPGEAAVYTPHVDHDRGTVAGWYGRTPDGIILHGSRSGVVGRPLEYEYHGTRRYAASGIELGWTVTVGDDMISLHMSPREWGWNARQHSSSYLACEFAQATVNDPITDGQVRAFCWWVENEVLPVWPGFDTSNLPMHSELPAGIRDGKTDTFPRGDPRAFELRQRILVRLAGGEEEEDDLSAEDRAELDDLRNYVGGLTNDVLKPGFAAIEAAADGQRGKRWDTVRAQIAAMRQGSGVQ